MDYLVALALIVAPIVLCVLAAWILVIRFMFSPITSRLHTMLESTLPALSLVTRACSFGYFILQPPRFREANSFDHGNLCDHCQRALRRSALLSGSRYMLARTDEKIPLFDSLEDMKRFWSGCHFCEALLSKMPSDDRHPEAVQGYGTMDAIPGVGGGRLFLHVRYRRSLDRLSDGSLTASLVDTNGPAPSTTVPISIGPLRETAPSGPTFTGSRSTFDMIDRWIRDCAQVHESCRPSDLNQDFLPSRLIFVGSAKTSELRLVRTESDLPASQKPQYLALSHCWGGKIACKLTTENYTAMRQSIPQENLPRNFVDAIEAARHLGVPYLWIDSLCILQDSLEDWAAESPTMGLVFAHAICIIAATASDNSHGGCFRHRTSPRYERELMRCESQRCYISFGPPSVRTLFDTRVETAPLTKRAWVFQERLLSRRMVHFCADAVLFECNSINASEFDPAGTDYEREHYAIQDGRLVSWLERKIINPLSNLARRTEHKEDERARRGVRGALDVLQCLGRASDRQTTAEKVEFCKRWFDIVSAYSEGALTRQTDKLIALSGVAALVQAQAQVPYLAGLWDSAGALELQLLWVVLEPHREQLLYCAPSWSWASVNGRIRLLPRDDFETTQLSTKNVILAADVRDASVSHKDQVVRKANSLVDFGYLVISGPICGVSLPKDNSRTIQFQGAHLGSRGPSLRFFQDHSFSGESDGGWDGDLFAIHIMTVHRSESSSRDYGLVLRAKGPIESCRGPDGQGGEDGQDVYERVGVWMACRDTTHGIAGSLSTASMRAFIGAGFGPQWRRQEMKIL